MTTIAYRNGILACDSAVVEAGVNIGRVEKIFTTKNKETIAICGTLALGRQFVDWLNGDYQGDVETLKKSISDSDLSFNAVCVKSNGDVVVYDRNLVPVPVTSEYFAEGSGRDFALAAMACGKSAEEAVEIACKFDIYSSMPAMMHKCKNPIALNLLDQSA